MKKPGIETRLTILAIVIVVAVFVSGFLVHRSLTQIVNSIQSEASPDFRLIVIKNIALDLLEIENNVDLYALTKDKTNLTNYEKVSSRLKNRISILNGLPDDESQISNWNDSIQNLVEAKLEILEEIRRINTVGANSRQQFEELYSNLEKTEVDTLQIEVDVLPEKKKGIFRKIFGKKDTVTTRIDTTFIEKTVVDEEIKDEIQQLQTDLRKSEQRKNRRELQLIEQNIQISGKLNNLIARFEQAERDTLIEKTEEADRLATIIYERLSAFSISAVILLFVVLYLFVRFLQRAKTYQRVLTQAKHETEKLSSAKEVFIANVSHEMRTPVNAIYGLTEQLLKQPKDERSNEHLSVLLKSAEHLKKVVNDTLDFSKIQAKRLKLEVFDFSPENTIGEVIDLYKPEATEKNIELFYQCKSKLPKALLGDPFRLKQILINTVGNAVKFTEKGSVSIEVEIKEIKKEGVQLHFQIEDTGIGISKDNLELIFEDFVQVESDYKRKFGGTGLGLSIVKKLIELQDGKISIESEPEKGTKLSFYIPFKLGDPDKIKIFREEEIVIPDRVKRLKILGVDDELFNRYLLKVIFEKWGVNYYEATNGQEAVNLALENDFDLILMDVRMPVLSGLEASRQIMGEKPDSNIVAITAINSETELELFKQAGMNSYLLKPFSELELYNTVVSVLKINPENESSGKDFDLRELVRLTNGDNDFLKEMIRIFIQSAENGIENLRQYQKDSNWDAISETAHKMAAPCKHILANDLYDSIKKLEKYSEKRESLQSVPELIDFIERKVGSIKIRLTKLIETEKFNS